MGELVIRSSGDRGVWFACRAVLWRCLERGVGFGSPLFDALIAVLVQSSFFTSPCPTPVLCGLVFIPAF